MSTTMENIRNIAICGHSSTGKTSFTEQLLYLGGSITKPEKVESGKTVSDFADEEIAQHISIHTSCSHLNWQNVKANILDTPGASDFIGEVTAAFRAAESALLLVGADVGVQIGTINLWRQLDHHALPRMIFLNKMDKEHADFDKAIEDLKEKFKATFIPVAMPIGQAAAFSGVIDLIDPDSGGTKPWTGSRTDFCLVCHDGKPPESVSFPGKSDGSGFNKMMFRESSVAQTEAGCSSCHTAHGSPYPSLLKNLHGH